MGFFLYMLFSFLKSSNLHHIKTFYVLLLFIKKTPVFILFFYTNCQKPWIFWLYFSLHLLLYTSVTTILMSCFTQNAGYVTYKLKLYNQIRSPNMQKKVMFLWKQNRWYHSIIYSLINRIWVYPKNAILIFQTMILLVKQVLLHVYSVQGIKCKVVFYIY